MKFKFIRRNLSLASFYRMDATDTTFDCCKLHQVDFSIDLNQNSLKSTNFNEQVFIGLLKKYDIVIE